MGAAMIIGRIEHAAKLGIAIEEGERAPAGTAIQMSLLGLGRLILCVVRGEDVRIGHIWL